MAVACRRLLPVSGTLLLLHNLRCCPSSNPEALACCILNVMGLQGDACCD